jgi:hypothetical protein
VPEVGGPIDPNNEAHDLVMSVFGGMSKGERNRVKIRVRTAMAAQAQVEGRFLGGRLPYGYLIIDVGPHPNPAKAADGKRRSPPTRISVPRRCAMILAKERMCCWRRFEMRAPGGGVLHDQRVVMAQAVGLGEHC